MADEPNAGAAGGTEGGQNGQNGQGGAGGQDAGAQGAGAQGSGAQGAAGGDWLATLPADLRASPSLAKFSGKGVADLAGAYANLEGLIGRKGVIVPGEKDPPEVVAKFREALGVPAKPEDYGLKPPEKAAPGLWDEDFAKEVQGWAHEAALTPKQAQLFADKFAGKVGALMQAAEAKAKESQAEVDAALQKEFGAALPAKMELAKRAVQAHLGADAASWLQAVEGRVGGATLVKLFVALGEASAEDSPAGLGTGRSHAMTPAEAQAEINRIQADRTHPYHQDGMSAEKRAAVQRMTDLHRAAAAGGSRAA